MLGVSVMEGVRLAVGEGPMDVGKGPRSASEVSAMAVLVLPALICWAPPGGGRNIMTCHTAIRIRHKKIPSKTCGKSANAFQRSFITALLRSRPGWAGSRNYLRTGDRDCYDSDRTGIEIRSVGEIILE
jgi:hypothetical protein